MRAQWQVSKIAAAVNQERTGLVKVKSLLKIVCVVHMVAKKNKMNKRAPRIIFMIRAGRVGASKALLQAQSS